ncbi:MAG TPA: helix-turn-helix transcriptional regulator [Vicinamibacterales bacterium]|nr:helix-turn-helix transcriptional regulator [Vicinamibacterales bacterium]
MTAPLKTHWYFILMSLAGGNRHGLAIARDVKQLSGGQVTLWPATLYGSLEDLADAGWIAELADRDLPDESDRKKFYTLTRAGRAALDAETRRLADLVKLARSLSRRHT